MWRIDQKHGEYRVEILELQAPGGPREVAESVHFPCLTLEIVVNGLKLARAGRTYAIRDMIRREALGLPEPLIHCKNRYAEYYRDVLDRDTTAMLWDEVDKWVRHGFATGHGSAFEADADYRAWLSDPLTVKRQAERDQPVPHSGPADASDGRSP